MTKLCSCDCLEAEVVLEMPLTEGASTELVSQRKQIFLALFLFAVS